MYMMRRIGLAAVTMALALAGCDAVVEPAAPGDLPVPALSRGGAGQMTGVNWHPQQQLIAAGGTGSSGPVDGAWARLARDEKGISYQIHTRGLIPGRAYSLWLVVINNPAACASSPCSAGDIVTNPETRAQVRLGGIGTVAGGAGRGTMTGSAKVGPLSGWLEGRSLEDPSSAEVHLVINDHGPMLPQYMPGMISSYRAGCSDTSPFPGVFPPTALADGEPGPNSCLLYQAAVFQAQ